MRYEDLVFRHEALLKERLEPLGDGLSEYSFSNLYLFRKAHGYKVLFDEKIFISGKTYDGLSYLMPLFDLHEVGKDYLIKVIGAFDFFFPISGRMLKNLDHSFFHASYNMDDSDYVYSAEKFKTYRGRKLSEKKNLMKQFLII